MPLDVVTIEHGPHPEVLRSEAQAIIFPLSKEDLDFIEKLKDTFLKLNGVGLAAPQVGVAKKIIIYGISESAAFIRENAKVVPATVLINPHYTPTEDAQLFHDWEGCFSVEKLTGKVPRYNKIHYTACLTDGSVISEIAEGFTARVLQHEIDHVNGTLITDRLTADCVQGSPQEMSQLRYKEMSTEQLQRIQKMIKDDTLSTTTNTDRKQALVATLQIIETILAEKSS